MRIESNKIFPNRSTQAPSTERSKIDQKVSKKVAATKANAPDIITKQDLLTLAEDIKHGKVDRVDANSRFVSMVIGNSLPHRLGENEHRQLIRDITEFFLNDEDFQKKLGQGLMDLA